MPTWVIRLPPPPLKKPASPVRRSDTLRERSYLHCPLSVMGSLWPNGFTAILVRQVQLLSDRVQVAYLYLSPICLLACRTTSRPLNRLILFESVVPERSIEAPASSMSGGRAISPRTTMIASATA